jgi:hypothetical protein
VGEALRGSREDRGGRRRAAAHLIAALAFVFASVLPAQETAPLRLESGRFSVLAYPTDAQLARSIIAEAARNDTFPGLPRPRQNIIIEIAPDQRRFRDWVGVGAPEWGAAIAFPGERRIVMQGHTAGSDAGDPIEVLRHELAHLALHEYLGDRAPRWFDEGYASYAAGELKRDEILATNLALLMRGMPTLSRLDSGFYAGSGRAEASYALAYRAVADLAGLDRDKGLALFFAYWRESGSLEIAVRRAYGITLTAFEHLWIKNTRRRYGALALFADVTLGALVVLLMITPLYIARRRRDRRRMAALVAADEAADRAARQSALDALLREEGNG